MKQNDGSDVSNERGRDVSDDRVIAVCSPQSKHIPVFVDCVVVGECNE